MKPIFLLGYMGCGKTTLGQALADEMNLQFIDLDFYIEKRFHKKIREIFAETGESGFRDIERKMLLEVACFNDTVVACGGGTPCHFDNMEQMNHHGTTVFLTTDTNRLVKRLTLPGAKAKRPLIAGMCDSELHQFITNALNNRMPYYGKALLHFDSTDIETAEATTRCAKKLKEVLSKNKFLR